MKEGYSAGPYEMHPSFSQRHQLVLTAQKAFLQFSNLFSLAATYHRAHPSLLSSAEQLLLTLEELISMRSAAPYSMVAGELFFETFSVPLEENLSMMIENIVRSDVGGITFQPGLSRGELVSFAYLLQRYQLHASSESEMEAILLKEGISHITLQRVYSQDGLRDDSWENEKRKAFGLYCEAAVLVKEIFHTLQSEKTFNIVKTQAVLNAMVENIIDNPDALIGLTGIRMNDDHLIAHPVNVAILAIGLGSFLSLNRRQLAVLGLSGLLHDIGSVNIPPEIVSKPGHLTEGEREVVKRVSADGALMLLGMPGVSPLVMVAAFEQYLNHDITGDPPAGTISRQHPFSRIVAISDVYDAMTSLRIYSRIQTTPDEVVRILINKRDDAFDPALVKAFANMAGIFPIGTLLLLNTGERGLVIHQTRDLLRPRVLLLKTFDGKEKDEVNLLDREAGKFKRSVVATIDPNVMKVSLKQYFAQPLSP